MYTYAYVIHNVQMFVMAVQMYIMAVQMYVMVVQMYVMAVQMYVMAVQMYVMVVSNTLFGICLFWTQICLMFINFFNFLKYFSSVVQYKLNKIIIFLKLQIKMMINSMYHHHPYKSHIFESSVYLCLGYIPVCPGGRTTIDLLPVVLAFVRI